MRADGGFAATFVTGAPCKNAMCVQSTALRTSVHHVVPHVARSPWRAQGSYTKERQWPGHNRSAAPATAYSDLSTSFCFRLGTRLRATKSNVSGERRPTKQKGGQVRKEKMGDPPPDWRNRMRSAGQDVTATPLKPSPHSKRTMKQ